MSSENAAYPAFVGDRTFLRGRHIVFVVNVDWFFISHRLPIAVAAVRQGARVTVVSTATGRHHQLEAYGIDHLAFDWRRGERGVVGELDIVRRLGPALRRLRPDLIHTVTLKPVVYGSLCARLFTSKIPVVNAISGLGSVFLGSESTRRLKGPVSALYRAALRHPNAWTIFQNPDDLDLFRQRGWVRADRATLIRGSGVDTAVFYPGTPAEPPLVVLPARLLRDKGVQEFADAARILSTRLKYPVRFALVGGSDPQNPTGLSEKEVKNIVSEGFVEVWGFRTDMDTVLRSASIVVLPSYREGLPKALLEAAASGKPLVATDVPGCREIAVAGSNALLVPPRDARSLAEAIQRLLSEYDLRAAFGKRSRQLAVREFSVERIVEATLYLYARALGTPKPGRGS